MRGRARTPALVRNHAKLAVDGPVHETWQLGYLIDTIYLRDLWMHRADAAHALSKPIALSADHDYGRGTMTVDSIDLHRRSCIPCY